MARIIKIDAKCPDIKKIKAAAEAIKKGKIIAFATDTFYGLGVDAANKEAIKKIYLVKGREFKKPILVLIENKNNISKLVKDVPDIAKRLMDRFWPGPLTLIFKAADDVPKSLLGGSDKIGVRIPYNPLTLLLLKTADCPITATSANLSGKPSPSDTEDIIKDLGEKIDIILDSGKTSGIKESTVIDITEYPPVCIREGMISDKEIEDFIGVKLRRVAL